jgi:uncharacterized protein (TIGR03435 family)
LGPQLHRHEDGPACDLKVARIAGAELKGTDIFPSQCGGVEAEFGPNHTILMGSRNAAMGAIAESFEVGRVGRPVVDATGLTGRYDFKRSTRPSPGNAYAACGRSVMSVSCRPRWSRTMAGSPTLRGGMRALSVLAGYDDPEWPQAAAQGSTQSVTRRCCTSCARCLIPV